MAVHVREGVCVGKRVRCVSVCARALRNLYMKCSSDNTEVNIDRISRILQYCMCMS